jgi:N-acetylglucosamine kinase-like BadF-type ATPase
MKYLIGIDAGGTKTKCAVADLTGNILLTEAGKSVNYLIAGADNTSANLFGLIFQCLKKLDGNFSEVQQIVIGIAGAGRLKDAKQLERSFVKYSKSKKVKINPVKVVSDASIALEGVFPGKPGCILIAGTGSILFGKDVKGKIHSVGGFGRLIGDEGSGYSIGRKALQAVSRELDGRAEQTLITKTLFDQMNISDSEELITKIYKENFDIASIAPIVILSAEKKDKPAQRILNEEAEELALHIKSMIRKMNIKKLNVAFTGGLISNKNFYSTLLTKKIKSSLPNVTISKPRLSPVEGAILMAKENLNE